MVVGIDKAGHNDATFGVDKLSVAIFGFKSRKIAHFFNDVSFDGYSAILVETVVITGDKSSVTN